MSTSRMFGRLKSGEWQEVDNRSPLRSLVTPQLKIKEDTVIVFGEVEVDGVCLMAHRLLEKRSFSGGHL